MKKREYNKIRLELLYLSKKIMEEKQPEYTNNNKDVLYNFKSIGGRINVEPLKVWAIFFDKHVQSILSNITNDDIIPAEPIETRFADAINYLVLGLALMVDVNKENHKKILIEYKNFYNE